MVSRALGLFLFVMTGACAAGKPVTVDTAPASSTAPAGAGSSTAPTASATAPLPASGHLVTSPCVLHAGGGKSNRSKTKTGDAGAVESKHGSCWYNVECVREPGNAKPGDGFVGLSCNDDLCTCTIESATNRKQQSHSFSIGEACVDADLAKKLLIEQCMAGMPRPKE